MMSGKRVTPSDFIKSSKNVDQLPKLDYKQSEGRCFLEAVYKSVQPGQSFSGLCNDYFEMMDNAETDKRKRTENYTLLDEAEFIANIDYLVEHFSPLAEKNIPEPLVRVTQKLLKEYSQKQLAIAKITKALFTFESDRNQQSRIETLYNKTLPLIVSAAASRIKDEDPSFSNLIQFKPSISSEALKKQKANFVQFALNELKSDSPLQGIVLQQIYKAELEYLAENNQLPGFQAIIRRLIEERDPLLNQAVLAAVLDSKDILKLNEAEIQELALFYKRQLDAATAEVRGKVDTYPETRKLVPFLSENSPIKVGDLVNLIMTAKKEWEGSAHASLIVTQAKKRLEKSIDNLPGTKSDRHVIHIATSPAWYKAAYEATTKEMKEQEKSLIKLLFAEVDLTRHLQDSPLTASQLVDVALSLTYLFSDEKQQIKPTASQQMLFATMANKVLLAGDYRTVPLMQLMGCLDDNKAFDGLLKARSVEECNKLFSLIVHTVDAGAPMYQKALASVATQKIALLVSSETINVNELVEHCVAEKPESVRQAILVALLSNIKVVMKLENKHFEEIALRLRKESYESLGESRDSTLHPQTKGKLSDAYKKIPMPAKELAQHLYEHEEKVDLSKLIVQWVELEARKRFVVSDTQKKLSEIAKGRIIEKSKIIINRPTIAEAIKAIYKIDTDELKGYAESDVLPKEAFRRLRQFIKLYTPKKLISITLEQLGTDTQCQRDFLYQVAKHQVARIRCTEAYKLFKEERNDKVKQAWQFAILTTVSTDELCPVELFELVKDLSPAELERIQKKNPAISRFIELYRDSDYVVILKYADQLLSTDSHTLTEKNTRAVFAAIDKLKAGRKISSEELAAVFDKTARKAMLSQIIAHVPLLKDSKERVGVGLERNESGALEAAKRAKSLRHQVPIIPDKVMMMPEVEQRVRADDAMKAKDAEVGFIQSMMDVIIELLPSEAASNPEIETFLNSCVDKLVQHLGFHYVREICTGFDVVTHEGAARSIKLSKKAQQYIIGYLLDHYSLTKEMTADQKSQDIIDDLVNRHADPEKIYKIFSSLENTRDDELKQCNRLALAIVKSQVMRDWLCSERKEPASSPMRGLSPSEPSPRQHFDTIFRRIASIKPPVDLMELFANWQWSDEVKKLLSTNPPGMKAWLIAGMLTNEGIVQSLKRNKLLKEYAQQLDWTLLTKEQIKTINKEARLAFIKQLPPWESFSSRITDANRELILALTEDFTVSDVDQLSSCETALLLLFKKHSSTVGTIIINDPSKKKAAWYLLQALAEGFLHKGLEAQLHASINAEEKTTVTTPWNIRHKLVQHGFYQADGSYILEKNQLVDFDLSLNRDKFLRKASAKALEFALTDPEFINQPGINLNNDLKRIAKNPTAQFSALQLKACITKMARSSSSSGASISLLAAIPGFLAATKRLDEPNIDAICSLCQAYCAAFPNDGHRQQLLKSFDANKDPRLNKVRGQVIFPDSQLLQAYFKEKTENYTLPNFWIVRVISKLFSFALYGAAFGLMWNGFSYAVGGLNPLNWFSGSSRFQSISNLLGGFSGAVLGFLVSSGLSPVAAGFLLPVAIGAGSFLAGGAAIYTIIALVSKGIDLIKSVLSRQPAVPEGQAILDVIASGLEADPNTFIMLINNDKTFNENVCKKLSLAYDQGFDIAGRKDVDPVIRRNLAIIRDSWRAEKRFLVTTLILDLCFKLPLTILSLGLSPSVWPSPMLKSRASKPFKNPGVTKLADAFTQLMLQAAVPEGEGSDLTGSTLVMLGAVKGNQLDHKHTPSVSQTYPGLYASPFPSQESEELDSTRAQPGSSAKLKVNGGR